MQNEIPAFLTNPERYIPVQRAADMLKRPVFEPGADELTAAVIAFDSTLVEQGTANSTARIYAVYAALVAANRVQARRV